VPRIEIAIFSAGIGRSVEPADSLIGPLQKRGQVPLAPHSQPSIQPNAIFVLAPEVEGLP
jgi:hypothetical protein